MALRHRLALLRPGVSEIGLVGWGRLAYKPNAGWGANRVVLLCSRDRSAAATGRLPVLARHRRNLCAHAYRVVLPAVLGIDLLHVRQIQPLHRRAMVRQIVAVV